MFAAFDQQQSQQKTGSSVLGLTPGAQLSYLGFLAAFGLVWFLLSDQDVSVCLTLSVMTQALAFGLLTLQVEGTRSMEGLSARTLMMYAAMLCLRLSSTLIYNGYLPVDPTGDHVYQISDLLTLGLVARLLYSAGPRGAFKHTYQVGMDTVDVRSMMFVCFVMAVLVHPEMNHSFVPDVAWTSSLYVDAAAMFPQIWMISKNGGAIDGLTGHWVALMALSRAMSGYFWYGAMEDVYDAHQHSEDRGSFGGGAAGGAVVAAHVLMVLFLGDFLFSYVKGVWKNGLCQQKMDIVGGAASIYDI